MTLLRYRRDDYDEAVGTLLSIGAAVLKVAGERVLEFYKGGESVNKLGIAAPIDIIKRELSAEQLLRQQQVRI